MKNSLIAALTFVLPLAVGCGGSSKKPVGGNDLAVKTDGGNNNGGDMTVSAGCTTVATWAGQDAQAYFGAAGGGYTDWEVSTSDSTGTLTLYYDYYNMTGVAPTTPHAGTLSTSDTLQNCTDCVVLVDQDAQVLYFGQSGTTNATTLDSNATGTGTIAASGSNIHLLEWDTDADAKVDGGKCYDIGSFSMSGMYDNTATDGGSN